MMIRFLGDHCFDTYVYAPKDDVYHRAEWRRDYPENLSQKLRELVQACQIYSVNFVFTVSPGLSIVYSDPKEIDLLAAKLHHVIEMGCKSVGILLDDIATELGQDRDKKAFGSLGKAHAFLVNSARDKLLKNTGDLKVMFCSTYYANNYLGKRVHENDYLYEIGSEMDSHVDILWTGKHVVSQTIAVEDAKDFGVVVKRKPLLWDNYPVNDYFRGSDPPRLRLNVGPFRGRAADLSEYISGYLSNPMNESESSRIPLSTLADYLSDPVEYSPDSSFAEAVQTLCGNEDSRRELRLLIYSSKANVFDQHESEDLRSRVRELIALFVGQDAMFRDRAVRLKEEFKLYDSMGESISAGTRNKKLQTELEPLVAKLVKLAKLGISSVEALVVLERGDDISDELSNRMRDQAREALEDKTQVLGEVNFGWIPRNEEGGVDQSFTIKVETDSRNQDDDAVDDLGLPRVYRDAPVVELYKFVSKAANS
jgi:hyaluronoglucosaminidase